MAAGQTLALLAMLTQDIAARTVATAASGSHMEPLPLPDQGGLGTLHLQESQGQAHRSGGAWVMGLGPTFGGNWERPWHFCHLQWKHTLLQQERGAPNIESRFRCQMIKTNGSCPQQTNNASILLLMDIQVAPNFSLLLIAALKFLYISSFVHNTYILRQLNLSTPILCLCFFVCVWLNLFSTSV